MFKYSLVLLIFLYFSAEASEHGAAPTEGLPPVEKAFSGQQNEKWAEVQNSLLQLKTKVDAQAIVVTELLKSKKSSDSKISPAEIDTLKKEHEKLKSLTADYNQMLAVFQFRFPEKGLESGRKYIRLENQTLEQMENAPTFEGRLKKLNRKIKKQYLIEGSEDEHALKKPTFKPTKLPVGSKGLDSQKSSEPQVTDQINLVK